MHTLGSERGKHTGLASATDLDQDGNQEVDHEDEGVTTALDVGDRNAGLDVDLDVSDNGDDEVDDDGDVDLNVGGEIDVNDTIGAINLVAWRRKS